MERHANYSKGILERYIARAALLGVVADMPATRKLTGYLCHKGIMPTTIVTSFYPFEEGLAHLLQFVA